jgi:CRP/FNR family transcriptional regulator, cyclic AMP receptor protein
MATNIDIALLQGFHCFHGISEEEAGAVAHHLEMVHLPLGQVLFRQGDPCNAMYLLRSRRMKIEVSVPGRPDHLLTTLEAGTIFGEIGLLLNEPRSTTAVAGTPVDLWRISRTAFEGAIERGESWTIRFLLATAQGLAHRLLDVGSQLVAAIGKLEKSGTKPKDTRELELLRNRLFTQWSF